VRYWVGRGRKIDTKGASRSLAAVVRLSLLGMALALAFAGCSSGSTSTNTAADLQLGQVPWCDKPLISFQDDGTTTQKIITDWSAVKDQLGFTPYLPTTMPNGTCLALAGGSIHNPIYGGQLSITYVLPKVGPLSFSQAPKRPNLPTATQCIQSTQDNKTTICAGVKENTSITIASRQTATELQAVFGTLQPNVSWLPANTNQATPTPTPAKAATPTATASK
jgi:hypothetical protein